jgi:uncharacterized phage protein gp47/JayE
MALNSKTFTALVQGMAAAIQSSASGLVDLSVGSIERAFTEATAGVVLWIQGLILALLLATRASTSVGADLDSFIADLGSGPTPIDPNLISRFLATGSSGSVVFSRLSTIAQVVLPVGSTVSTQDGSQQYSVPVDLTNTAYSAPLNGYVLPIGTVTVTVKVTALTPGSASNAVAGAINTITSACPGIDAVTNPVGLTSGADAESDLAFLARFRLFIASLREATPKALKFAITNLQAGVACALVENFQYGGAAQAGFFYFIVDDGSGAPPGSLVTAAGQMIDAHRAAGIQFGVYAPTIVLVPASMTVVNSPTSTHAVVVATVLAAVTNYLNTLPLQASVLYSRIWQVAQDASPDVVEITGLTVNSGTTDVAITVNQVAKAGVVTVV